MPNGEAKTAKGKGQGVDTHQRLFAYGADKEDDRHRVHGDTLKPTQPAWEKVDDL